MPERIVIPHDDHHGKLVGWTRSGHQFFITTPFTWLGESREFVALYLFDRRGELTEAVIDDLGDRAALVGEAQADVLPGNVARENETVYARIAGLLDYIGPHEFRSISVQPFQLMRHGVEFGLLPPAHDPDEPLDPDEEVPYVLLMPGDYMAFTPPWDGSYDT